MATVQNVNLNSSFILTDKPLEFGNLAVQQFSCKICVKYITLLW
jgi:hypothetical protein